MSQHSLKKKVESILFSVGRKITVEELAKLLRKRKNLEEIEYVLRELKKEYEEKENSSLKIQHHDVHWKLTVREEYIPVVQNIVTKTDLTKTVMETLAVIAYKSPILQSEVIRIRTNKAYDHLKELEELGYISRTPHGRTKMIKLGQKFFDYFDLPPEALKAKFAKVQEMEDFIKDKESEIAQSKKKTKAQEAMIKEQEEKHKKLTAEEMEQLDEKIAELPEMQVYETTEVVDASEPFEEGPIKVDKEKLGDLEVVEEEAELEVYEEKKEEKQSAEEEVEESAEEAEETPAEDEEISKEELEKTAEEKIQDEIKQAIAQKKEPVKEAPRIFAKGVPEDIQKKIDKRVDELLHGEQEPTEEKGGGEAE